MAQLSYNYQTPKGVAGALLDIAPYRVDSRLNGEETAGALKFGMGVVRGNTPGSDVLIPTKDSEAAEFEGLLLTGYTNEMNMDGEITIKHLQTVGVLKYGNAWARLAEGIAPEYGDDLYLVIDGPEAGLFTNDDTDTLAVNGRFLKEVGTGNVAAVEIFNQKS